MIPAIQKLGGRKAVADRVSRARSADGKKPIGPHAVRMWEQRGSVPGYAVLELMAWAQREGLPLKLDDFRAVSEAA